MQKQFGARASLGHTLLPQQLQEAQANVQHLIQCKVWGLGFACARRGGGGDSEPVTWESQQHRLTLSYPARAVRAYTGSAAALQVLLWHQTSVLL